MNQYVYVVLTAAGFILGVYRDEVSANVAYQAHVRANPEQQHAHQQ